MSKKKLNIGQMQTRIQEINTRFAELADTLEKEERALTTEEKDEQTALRTEKEVLQLRCDRFQAGDDTAVQETTLERAFGDVVIGIVKNRAISPECAPIVNGNEIDIPLTRDIQDSTTVTPLIPLTIGDIIQPLEKGLILSKVGVKMQYGIVGDWVLPVVAGIEATIEDENAEVADTTIDISKLQPTPKRCSLAIPVSNRAIDQSAGVLLDVVRTQMVMGLTRLLNKWMFSPTQITSKASNGCFVAPTTILTVGDAFTWKDVVALKGSVMKTGVIFDGTAAYVCSATTYADLESTPRDAGSGLMILQDGKINGYPVFVTEYLGDGVLGFGIFSYELVGQFGKMRMIVDPYTGAKKNLMYFVLNTDFDMLSVRPEAFGISKLTPAP